jgi:hypothetical protein
MYNPANITAFSRESARVLQVSPASHTTRPDLEDALVKIKEVTGILKYRLRWLWKICCH